MAATMLLMLVPAVFAMYDMPATSFGDADMGLQELYARDSEAMPAPLAFGNKYMTGGAGEGLQQLADGNFEFRQQVKSDSALPAYCNPPNPCPIGFNPSNDGCETEFENTAQFSKKYQESQNCLCDEEHMRNCPSSSRDQSFSGLPTDVADLTDAIEAYLDTKNVDHHKELVAKKGDQSMDPLREHYPRRKRSTDNQKEDYSWLKGERLHRVAKKGGHVMH